MFPTQQTNPAIEVFVIGIAKSNMPITLKSSFLDHAGSYKQYIINYFNQAKTDVSKLNIIKYIIEKINVGLEEKKTHSPKYPAIYKCKNRCLQT